MMGIGKQNPSTIQCLRDNKCWCFNVFSYSIYSFANRSKYPDCSLSSLYLSSHCERWKNLLAHLFCSCLTDFGLVWFETGSSYKEPDWDIVTWLKLPSKVKPSCLIPLNDSYHAPAHWQQVLCQIIFFFSFKLKCITHRHCFHASESIHFLSLWIIPDIIWCTSPCLGNNLPLCGPEFPHGVLCFPVMWFPDYRRRIPERW